MQLETLQCPGCWQWTLTLVPPSMYNTVMHCSATFCGTVAVVADLEVAEEGFDPRFALAVALGVEEHLLQFYTQEGFDVMDIQYAQNQPLTRSACTLIAAKKYPTIVEDGKVLFTAPNRSIGIAPEQFDAELKRLWAEALRMLEQMSAQIFPDNARGWAEAAITFSTFPA